MPISIPTHSSTRSTPDQDRRAARLVRERGTHRQWLDRLDEAERRHPLGHVVHLAVGTLFLGFLPIGTAPSNILSVVLLAVSLLRWRSIVPFVPLLLRWWPAPAALLLTGWLALSLLWSSDADRGIHLLISLRIVLLPLALAPLMGQRVLLAIAVLTGITIQAIVQVAEFAMHRGAWNFDGMARFGGMTGDPGKAALWDAIGVCGGAAVALCLAPRMAWSGGAVALVNLLATVASGTRRQLAALLVAVPAMFGWIIVTLPERRRRTVIVVAVAMIAALAAWPLVGPSLLVRLRQTASQLDAESPPPVPGVVHYDLRAYYWHATVDGFLRRPLIGLGLGGAADAIARSTQRGALEPWLRDELTRAFPDRSPEEIDTETRGRLESSHPHSTWLQLLAEGGLIGFVLAVAAWMLAWISSLRRAAVAGVSDPIALACSAALLLWAVGAIFDASINASSLGAVVVLALLGGAGGAAAGGAVGARGTGGADSGSPQRSGSCGSVPARNSA